MRILRNTIYYAENKFKNYGSYTNFASKQRYKRL